MHTTSSAITLARFVVVAALSLMVPALGRAQTGGPAVAASLSASEVTVQTLPVAAAPGPFSVQVILGGAVVDLVLEPVTLRAPGFALLVDDGAGLHPVQPPVEMNFAGSAIGRPGSAARMSVVDGSWRGVIDLGDGGQLWWVQPLRDAQGQAAAAPDQHAVFAGDAVLPDGHGCPGGVETGMQTAARPKGAPVSCARETQIAFDADMLFYQQNGSSVPNTNADIDSVVNAMNLIYARDVGVSFVVTTQIVRTTAALYNSTNANTLLNMMSAEWTANQTAVVRDIAHLMTGREIDGTTIGLAFNGAVCSSQFGYGLSQSRYSANMALRVSLTCHEVGHNFSADHCNGDADCRIMCSTNGGCAGNTGFGSRSIGVMRPYSQAAACLAASAGFGTPVAPHATADTAMAAPGGFTDIDVLANDFDGNCHGLSIQSFPASTPKATLTRLVGAGPGGRDLIRYSPFAASTGTDVWTYTLADTSAATMNATVTMTIPAPKAPDYSGPTRTQLDGNYYRLQGRDSVPLDFGALFNFRTNTYTNHNGSFASTAGEFESSGRSDNFCSVTTANLTIPTAGAWTFFTTSSEGSRLYIDGALVVVNDFVHASVEGTGPAVTLTAGVHALRIEHFELTGACEVTARWQGPGTAKQIIPASRLTNLQLRFHEQPPALVALPTFNGMTPIANAPVASINFASSSGNFGASARPSDVGAVFTGLISVPAAGLYTFFLESDDGSRLTLGTSQVVVNHDGAHAMTEASGQATLQAGLHTFKVEYFNASTPSGLIARWQGPGIAKAVIPAANLFRLPVGCNAADVGGAGGVAGADGVLDNNDFIAFINLFFASNPIADLGRAGGLTPGDGVFDNNDFIAFINFFFAPCN